MRTPNKQLLSLIATTVLLAQGASASGFAKWGEETQAQKAAHLAGSDDATSPVWDELSRMSSGYKGRNLIAGSQTEGDAGSNVEDKSGAEKAGEGATGDAKSDQVKADGGDKSGDDAKPGDDAKATPTASGDKSSDAAANAGVTSSLKGLTPTQSYMKCREAMLNAKSVAEIIPYLTHAAGAEAAADLAKNPEDAKSKLELLKLVMPPQVKVTNEKITGDTAVLTAIPLAPSAMDEGMSQMMTGMAQGIANAMGVKDKMPPTQTETIGSIYMSREDGVWKQDKEKWNSKMTEAAGK